MACSRVYASQWRPFLPFSERVTAMANAALNVNLDDLSGYEKLDVYLKDDGSLQQRGIGDA